MVVIDKDIMTDILKMCHDDVTAGHFSTDRTIERLKNMAWFPDWKNITDKYCRSSQDVSWPIKQLARDMVSCRKLMNPDIPGK